MLSNALGCIVLAAGFSPEMPVSAALPASAPAFAPASAPAAIHTWAAPHAAADEALKGISQEDQSKYKEAVAHGLTQRQLSLKMRAALAKMVANRPPKDEDVKAYEAALKALDKESAATYEVISQERWTEADRTKMADIIAKIVSAEVPAAAAPAQPKKG